MLKGCSFYGHPVNIIHINNYNNYQTHYKHKWRLQDSYYQQEHNCESIYVAISKGDKHKYDSVRKDSRVVYVEIEPGGGCGNAVKQLLDHIVYDTYDLGILKWGDTIHINPELYRRTLESTFQWQIHIPVIKEKNPYTSLVKDENGKWTCLFSKYNEIEEEYGLHDQSLFFFNITYLKRCMKNWEENEESMVKKWMHGQEFQFLDIINAAECNVFEVDEYMRAESFNTVEEYEELIEKYKTDKFVNTARFLITQSDKHVEEKCIRVYSTIDTLCDRFFVEDINVEKVVFTGFVNDEPNHYVMENKD